MTAFAAAPAGAATAGTPVGEITVAVAAQESPTTAPPPPAQESPTTAPPEPPPAAEPPTTGPEEPPAVEAPPQVPVTPKGGADTGSLDPAPEQGPNAGVVALGGMALLAAGGLGIAGYRRRQHS